MKKFLISLLLMLPLVLSAEAQQKIGIVNTAVIMEALPDVKEKLMAPIRTKVTTAISKVCEAQGCAYIFESGTLLATGSTALDLTQAVKDALGIKATSAATTSTTKPAPKK